MKRLYDNDKDVIKDVAEHFPEIEVYHVDDTKPNRLVTMKDDGQYDKLEYIHRFLEEESGANKCALHWKRRQLGEPFMPSQGMTKEMIDDLITWSACDGHLKTVYLDWDRTMTVVEGVIQPTASMTEDNILKDVTPIDILEYILGGPERFRMMQSLLKKLEENQVSVYILTNNSTAAFFPAYFRYILGHLHPLLDLAHIIPAKRFGSKVDALRVYEKN